MAVGDEVDQEVDGLRWGECSSLSDVCELIPDGPGDGACADRRPLVTAVSASTRHNANGSSKLITELAFRYILGFFTDAFPGVVSHTQAAIGEALLLGWVRRIVRRAVVEGAGHLSDLARCWC